MSDFDQHTSEPGTAPPGEAPRPGLISSASAPERDRVSQAWTQADADAAAAAQPAHREPPKTAAVELSGIEARVLGAMVEKSFLTPDIYPMTTNAIATACNQKTNRDPVVDYSAVEIDATLLELRQRNLVRRVHTPGSRATKHRQTLDDALALDPPELALVSVLLLRGPQTVGELRLRTERHDVGFDDLGAVDACLEALAARPTPLVRQLPRRPGHKENRWEHLLSSHEDGADRVDDADVGHGDDAHSGDDPAHAPDPNTPGASAAAPTPRGAAQSTVMAAPGGAVPAGSDLVARVETLEATVALLTERLQSLADSLGESFD